MGVNTDADTQRLMSKYGVKVPEHMIAKRSFSRRPKKYFKPGAQKTSEVYKDYLRWKKDPSFKKWMATQFAKQDALCYYCDVSLLNRRTNVEHIIPLSKGGTNHKKNLVLACGLCNKDKGDRLLEPGELVALRRKHDDKQRAYREQIKLGLQLRDRFKTD
jgi:5-methylcytosine-specific restriction endonuclease McrA